LALALWGNVPGALASGASIGLWGIARTSRIAAASTQERVSMCFAAFPVLALGVVVLRAGPLLTGLFAIPLLATHARANAAALAATVLWNAGGMTLYRSVDGAPSSRHFHPVVAARLGATGPNAHYVVHRQDGTRQVFVGGSEVFASTYDARVAESIVHPAMALAKARDRVLVVGGECWGVVREVAKYPEVAAIDQLHLQPGLSSFCDSVPAIAAGIRAGPAAPVRHFDDVSSLLANAVSRNVKYEVLLILPPHPPSNPARLNSGAFFSDIAALSAPQAVVAARLGGFNARRAAYCAYSRLRERFAHALPYHVYVGIPSGPEQQLFAVAADFPLQPAAVQFPVPTTSLYPALWRSWTDFPESVRFPDVGEPEAGCSSLLPRRLR
jgi:spermidine synthase